MKLARRVRNKLRGLLQMYGSESAKRRLWNAEFAGGRWDFTERTPNDCIYPYVEKYANGGRILDLGCGSGNTSNEIPASVYADYTGVDISDVAIEKAAKKSEENGRSAKNRYVQSDIASYEPSGQFDLILFRDSIYYLPPARIKAALERYSRQLNNGGVVVVKLCDWSGRYKPILELIERNFEVVEKYLSDTRAADRTMVGVIVFRQRPLARETERPTVDGGAGLLVFLQLSHQAREGVSRSAELIESAHLIG